jgi:hypothetical protein
MRRGERIWLVPAGLEDMPYAMHRRVALATVAGLVWFIVPAADALDGMLRVECLEEDDEGATVRVPSATSGGTVVKVVKAALGKTKILR